MLPFGNFTLITIYITSNDGSPWASSNSIQSKAEIDLPDSSTESPVLLVTTRERTL
jgi:hypothetical protein